MHKQELCLPKRFIIFDSMRILQICVLVLIANLMVPVFAIHFMEISSDDVVCELMEDFGEEEEDGESVKDIENSIFFRDWHSYCHLGPVGESISKSAYPENNASLYVIILEVKTPPPQKTMC